MAPRSRCPRCGGTRVWILKDGRYRCARCRFDWRPGRLPLRLTPSQWRVLLRWFVRGVPSAEIARETRLDRKRVLRALTVVRRAILRSYLPDVRPATEVDRPPLVHSTRSGRSKPASVSRQGSPAFGLYVAHGREWVEVIPPSEAEELNRALRGGRFVAGPLSRRFDRYVAVVSRGRLSRLPESTASRPAMPFGRIEAFWAYLQRQLRAKGGIRRERLALYLAEYVWRHHHRHVSQTDQVRKLGELMRERPLRWKE